MFDKKEYMRLYRDRKKEEIKEYRKTDKYKATIKEYHKTDKFKEYRKKYEKTDKFKEYRKEFYKTDKYKTYQKEYRKTDKCKEYNKKYNKSDKHKELQKEYLKTDKWKLNQKNYTHRRRQIIKTTDDKTVTLEFINNLIILQKWECKWCKEKLIKKWKVNYHIDHIIPISKWWLHTASNIQLLCKNCNSSKNNRTINDIFFCL